MSYDDAWRAYYQSIEELRRRIYALEWMDRPGAREAAHYLFFQVQAAAFNMVIGPKRDYPTLPLHTTYEPVLYSLSNPSADFNYRFGFLDGSRSYRITGKRNGPLFVDFQLINVIWGSEGARKVANYDLDELKLGPDGSFECVASATPQPGNWLKLAGDSSDNLLLIREVFDDWTRPRAEFSIQMIDDGRAGRPTLPESELIRRMRVAEKYIEFYVWDWAGGLTTRIQGDVGTNQFHYEIFKADYGAGNNPEAIYPGALYELGDDEAILVESDIPRARYWNVQLCDPLWQVLDFTYHQSSLNSKQAHVNADGRFRAVICTRDPGIANWLDPMSNPFGVMLFRFYRADRDVRPRITYKGSLQGALERLPADTLKVSASARAESLAKRADAARVRFRN